MIKNWKKYENKNIKKYIYNVMSSGKKQKNRKKRLVIIECYSFKI